MNLITTAPSRISRILEAGSTNNNLDRQHKYKSEEPVVIMLNDTKDDPKAKLMAAEIRCFDLIQKRCKDIRSKRRPSSSILY